MVENGIKWLKINEIASNRVNEILNQYSLIFGISKEDQSILNEIRSKANNGFIPNPDSLEEVAYEMNNPNILALAAFFHRELGRFLASLHLVERKYLKEIVGAYFEAISLLIVTLIINKNCNKLLTELIRTISELLLIIKKEQSDETMSMVRVLELIMSKLMMIGSINGERN